MDIQNKIELITPTLITIMLVLILINLLIYVSLLKNSPSKITKQMTMFWLVQLLNFLAIPFFTNGNLLMAIPFSFNTITCYIIYQACFGSLNKVVSFNYFFGFCLLSWPIAILNEFLFHNFTATTLPIAIAQSAAPLYMIYLILTKSRPEFKSIHHKWLLLVIFTAAVHTINFSLFRDKPEHFVWGWTTHLLLIAAFSVILSNFHTYMVERTEKERLTNLVEKRTKELNEKLCQLELLSDEKARLFRILLHDISNPMTTIVNSLSILIKENINEDKKNLFTSSAFKSANNIVSIISQVRTLEAMKTGKIQLLNDRINLSEAFELAHTIFSYQYENKGVKLLVDYPQQEILFQGNQDLFVNSVLCNLLSNSLKFSQPGSRVQLSFKIENENLIVSVQDQGVGMKQEKISRLFEMDKPTSSIGTMGEVGTGFGMPLIKNYLDQVKGNIQIISKTADEHQVDHGTRVELKFGLVENVESNQPGQVTH